ncbi:MAG TPA: GNAT family N-acetyltransferase [Verrucomicrobiae bacterium]|nr:GNAT family N-acetyltransferase [Verrucomicrobiae bacterium]
MAPQIRRYQPPDRAGLRQICCDTADAGQPVERFFPDREVFGDLLTNYYTEYEPESVFVAENGGEVVGYVTGCLDTKRFVRVMAWRIVPVVLVKALVRGTLWHPQTIRLLRPNLPMWLKSGTRQSPALNDYPAHLHVNVREGFRGQRLGQRLVEAFCERAKAAGVRGVHAGVSAENPRARHFFEELGFVEVQRQQRFRKPGDPTHLVETITFGKKLG